MSPPLGVVIVAYDSADVILDCLETLLAAAFADGTRLRVVVVDNASPDNTPEAIAAWASGAAPYGTPQDMPFAPRSLPKPLAADAVAVIAAGTNGGFAAGVNIGLAHLFADPAIGRVWVLNPDSVIPPGTPAAFANHDPGPFSLMGGRVTYYDRPDMIQIDGGTINRWTGVTGNINLHASIQIAAAPKAAEIDFITGASLVVSRAHYDRAGPMQEDYFLYYEEGDWAMRRGDLPLAICPAARVFHRAGSAIGSPVPGRIASPFSLYFKHRARMRFVRRHLPRSIASAWGYTLAKALQYRMKGWRDEAQAILSGAREAQPSAAIRARLSRDAAAIAFAPMRPDQVAPASASALSVASAVRNRPK
ncbi:MAG: glycosyltransferase family 2 protein [Gemmobacter sp.]